MKDHIILALESSCDETSAAVLRNGREVLSNIISSQIDIHQKYKGVVPEIASRCHTQCISAVTQQAVEEAGIQYGDIDAIAVTAGPGLVGGLLVGVAFAKGLAYSLGIPIIGVHHIEGHISANYITHRDLEPPFVALIVLGGHSHIVLYEDYCKYSLIGCTRDDAAGEAFDKVARVLGLPYPGGVHIDRLSKLGDPNAFRFNSVLARQDNFDFSFSGIKTNIINIVNNLNQKQQPLPVNDLAASFQSFVCNTLADKAVRAMEKEGIKKLVLAGGVAANSQLRNQLEQSCAERNAKFYCPELILCTDNAAMIGTAGYYRIQKGYLSDLELNANASLSLF